MFYSMNDAGQILTDAIREYHMGNLNRARAYAEKAEVLLRNAVPMDYLNVITLLQSIASRLHDLELYEKYEASVHHCMKVIYGDEAESYYAVHLLDACDCYINAGDIANAQWRLEQGINLLVDHNGQCALFDFLHACFNAKIHFHLEQYYQCIGECIRANDYWMEEKLIPDNAGSFLQTYVSNEALIYNLGCANLILISYAYGKINNYEDGLAILSELAKEPPQDYYLQISMDIALIELYIRSGQLDKARAVYHKYSTLSPKQYPDLSASLAVFSIALKEHGLVNSDLLHEVMRDDQLPNTLCYSRDAIVTLVYDRGLQLIQKEQYNEALILFDQLENKGISLTLFLLAKTQNYTSIPYCKKKADQYFDHEIRSLFLYYNEKLIYNHLTLLEYHFALAMDAYITCYENLGDSSISCESMYDFALKTKYISLEAAFLSHRLQSLEALNQYEFIRSADIQEKLSDEELLMEFCVTRTVTQSFYCVFFVSHESVHCIRICEKDQLDELIDRWCSLTISTVSSPQIRQLKPELQEIESKLRRILYRPIKPVLECNTQIKKLKIAPVDKLLQFPFSCLSVSANRYLEELYEITYFNTGKEVTMNESEFRGCFDTALVVGNPLLQGYPELPYAEEEAQSAAGHLGVTCYTRENADISLMDFTSCESASLIHIATHGIFEEMPDISENPDWNMAFHTMENSGLLFAHNELLSCNRISVMDLSHTELVILSGCNTGCGVSHAVEGIYGLRRAFRLAGCHHMIVSLWQIDDYVSCLFMQKFYEFLAEYHNDSKVAFYHAVNEIRLSYTQPYYWAGYVYIE